jgi:hypothetical protein
MLQLFIQPMNNIFLTIRTFDDPALMQDFIDLLKTGNVEYIIEENAIGINPLANLNPEISKEYEVKIASKDFSKVNELLISNDKTDLSVIDGDYYLYQFTNDELIDILVKSEEWSSTDYVLAQQILSKRGVDINKKNIEGLKEAHIAELQRPEKPQTALIVIGYILAFLGGFAGIFIGWYLKSNTRTLPDGKQLYSFNEKDRKQGQTMFVIGCICFVLTILLRIFIAAKQ